MRVTERRQARDKLLPRKCELDKGLIRGKCDVGEQQVKSSYRRQERVCCTAGCGRRDRRPVNFDCTRVPVPPSMRSRTTAPSRAARRTLSLDPHALLAPLCGSDKGRVQHNGAGSCKEEREREAAGALGGTRGEGGRSCRGAMSDCHVRRSTATEQPARAKSRTITSVGKPPSVAGLPIRSTPRKRMC